MFQNSILLISILLSRLAMYGKLTFGRQSDSARVT